MKINVQEELKRFKPWVPGSPNPQPSPPPLGLEAIMAQIRDLKKADLKIVSEVQLLRAELKNLIHNQEPAGISRDGQFQRRDDVCLSIYDYVQNQWKVALANQEETRVQICQEFLEYLEKLFAAEFNWAPMKTLGEKYNPREFDGFVAAERERYLGRNPEHLEIVTELRTGFRCRDQIVRKPIVEFFE